ncbi:hypothetical protein BRD04_08940 [Halobacteriales archaeon QS_9_67_17]|nr:MAG: hypothetical protein BRD04_08940 [Halobacteriales archaeon QS_9_67_17]
MRVTLGALGDSVTHSNVARMYDTTAELRTAAPAIEARDTTVSRAKFLSATRAFAGGLHDPGLSPGDPVLLYLPNCPEPRAARYGSAN